MHVQIIPGHPNVLAAMGHNAFMEVSDGVPLVDQLDAVGGRLSRWCGFPVAVVPGDRGYHVAPRRAAHYRCPKCCTPLMCHACGCDSTSRSLA